MIDLDELQALLGPGAVPARRALTGEAGIAMPAFTDHHVHLHLIDRSGLAAGGIAAVVDLGGDPASLARLPRAAVPRVTYAGAFLTAPSGYPIGRGWAPDAVSRSVTDASPDPGIAGGARTRVDEQADAGAALIKVALNAAAGPVFDRRTLDAVVAAARARGLPVVAHVEGDGMALLAIDAGVDALAHTPFTELLDAGLIERAAASGQIWISTLAIHAEGSGELQQAIANLQRFAAAGGRVLYGTDLGNGDQPLGVGARELRRLQAAGLHAAELVRTLADPWPVAFPPAGVATFVAGAVPGDEHAFADWLAGARVVPLEELVQRS